MQQQNQLELAAGIGKQPPEDAFFSIQPATTKNLTIFNVLAPSAVPEFMVTD